MAIPSQRGWRIRLLILWFAELQGVSAGDGPVNVNAVNGAVSFQLKASEAFLLLIPLGGFSAPVLKKWTTGTMYVDNHIC
ncbi:hypothetical protein GGS24DRAFT_456318 [Hypoxylon argillaceum]|nr:hypothetical protein GGS24DRAFT_456318 [Hypoxylon argillaceum]KAI1145300.1 hypothetical protein F4825DRAFT_253460 [Nemania diffusa]